MTSQAPKSQDLLTFLGPAADAFSFEDWASGEQAILKPALEAQGFTHVRFFMIEKDSFGPLVRGCRAIDPSCQPKEFFYA